MTTPPSFQDLRDFLCECPKGQVFDSLIAVELGLDIYETYWTAHCDMSREDNFENLVVTFLADVYELIAFEGDDIEALVSSVADD